MAGFVTDREFAHETFMNPVCIGGCFNGHDGLVGLDHLSIVRFELPGRRSGKHVAILLHRAGGCGPSWRFSPATSSPMPQAPRDASC